MAKTNVKEKREKGEKSMQEVWREREKKKVSLRILRHAGFHYRYYPSLKEKNMKFLRTLLALIVGA